MIAVFTGSKPQPRNSARTIVRFITVITVIATRYSTKDGFYLGMMYRNELQDHLCGHMDTFYYDVRVTNCAVRSCEIMVGET